MRIGKPRSGVVLFILLSALTGPLAAQAPENDLAERVRNAILRMPYYGVFDLVTFQQNGNDVTLGGYVYHAFLKDDARNEVREIPGIGKVTDKIVVLPVSSADDRIRHGVFHAIYSDSFLAHYGTPTGPGFSGRRNWGRSFGGWAGFRTGSWTQAPFSNMEPLGNYAINIIVKRGRVMLFGVVANDTDKVRAEQVAKGVSGVFGVENHIEVAQEK